MRHTAFHLPSLAVAAGLAFLSACGGGGGSAAQAPASTAPAVTAPPQSQTVLTPGTATFTVTATGTAPLAYQWKRNGADIAGATSASYTTPATATTDNGATYTVTVSNSAGTVTSSAATLTVNPGRVRLFTSSWGDATVRITDDLISSPNPATPLTLAGAATGITGSAGGRDDLAVDPTRNLLYHTLGGVVRVWTSAATVSGNTAPARTITFTGATGSNSVCLDPAADRLFVILTLPAGKRLAILNQASTKNGAVTPDATVDLGFPMEWLFLDTANNRLYGTVGSSENLYVYNGVGTLASGAVAPDRVITFSGLSLRDLSVDAARDRLYVASRAGAVYVFANASTLNGTIANPAAAAAAWWNQFNAMGVLIDSQDRVWWWGDSATGISMYANASALTGQVTKPADKVLAGVVNMGYGWAIWQY
ncbi:MAG: hypothetical protein U0P81_11720 [Holophagaceae bacterium]